MGQRTVALSYPPLWEEFQHVLHCLFAKRCCPGEDDPDAVEVVFLALLWHPGHADHDWWDLKPGVSRVALQRETSKRADLPSTDDSA